MNAMDWRSLTSSHFAAARGKKSCWNFCRRKAAKIRFIKIVGGVGNHASEFPLAGTRVRWARLRFSGRGGWPMGELSGEVGRAAWLKRLEWLSQTSVHIDA